VPAAGVAFAEDDPKVILVNTTVKIRTACAPSGEEQLAAEALGLTYQVGSFQNLLVGETVTLTALCVSGDVVIGGYTRADGVMNLSGDVRYAAIAPTGPAPVAQGWTATATGQTSAPDFLEVCAVCLKTDADCFVPPIVLQDQICQGGICNPFP
jgi:hypothetical protein